MHARPADAGGLDHVARTLIPGVRAEDDGADRGGQWWRSTSPGSTTVNACAFLGARGIAWDAPTRPNPRVGCVLLGPDGTIVGEGYHHGAGSPHAEIEALKAAGTAHGTPSQSSPSSRATTPDARARAPKHSSRRAWPRSSSRSVTPTRSQGAAWRRWQPPGSLSTTACWWTTPARSTRCGPSRTSTAGPTSPGSSPPRLTVAAQHGTARRVGCRPCRPVSTPTGCEGSATPCWSAPTPSRSTTPS